MAEILPLRRYVEVNGQPVLTREEWWSEGNLHRVDGPAHRKWEIVNDAAVLTYEEWQLQGQTHRVDGPAWREWEVVDGQQVLTWEEWWLEGKRHRVGGPAARGWTITNGQPTLVYESWWMEEEYHRVDGPAVQWWGMTGVPTYKYWYLKGQLIEPHLLPATALVLQRWWRHRHLQRWSMIESHLAQAGLVIWPGLMSLIRGY